MGNSIVNAMKEQQEKNDLDTVEQLQTLQKMMSNKIAAESAQMKDDALQDKSLPIVAIVDTTAKYTVKVTSAPNEAIQGAVQDILSGDFIDGLTNLLRVALDEFLGNTSAGEKFKKDFHVVFANNSLLRVDFMLYKYDFSSEGLVDKVQNGFCYYAQIGVLDLKKVSPQVLLYELTKALGQDNLVAARKALEDLATFAERLYTTIDHLSRASVVDTGKPTEEEDEQKGKSRMRLLMKSLEADDE